MRRTEKENFKKSMVKAIEQAIINREYFDYWLDMRWLEFYMYKNFYLKPYRTRGYFKECDRKIIEEYEC